MKTKIILTALLCALNINANADSHLPKANVGIGYVSDFVYRGAAISGEATQWSAGANVDVSGISVFSNIMHNDAFDGDDATIFNAGVGKSFIDELLTAYIGVENRRVDGDNTLDVLATINVDTVLSPSVILARNTEDSLYTYELNLRHSVTTDIGKFCVVGGVGVTDVSNIVERDYSWVGAEYCKSLGDVDLNAGVYVVDSDDLSKDTVSSVSLSYKF